MSILNMPLPKSNESEGRPLQSYYLFRFRVGENGLLNIVNKNSNLNETNILFLNMLHNKNLYFNENQNILYTDDWIFTYSSYENIKIALNTLVGLNH